ncbi:hypothetical protein P8605_01050 [Streptomyces sp. T-3]|nr:hypothetical protein [Streptomyces sp. T-3]
MLSPALFATFLLLAAVFLSISLVLGDVRSLVLPGRGRHRRISQGRHATRGGR